jgi:two-component system LytT family response regulator
MRDHRHSLRDGRNVAGGDARTDTPDGAFLRVAIADDELLARTRIARLLAGEANVEIVANCASALDLVETLRENPVDALFLDIEMPGADGFAVLDLLPEPLPRVVFVTAYSDYAARAFEIDASDYLVKPVSQERLLESILRIRRDLSARPARPAAPGRAPLEHLTLKIGREMRRVAVDDIDRIEAHANYLALHTAGGEAILRHAISWMSERLDAARFLRVHRSHIVRVAAVARIATMPYGRYRFTLRDGSEVVSGRSHRDRIRRTFRLDASAD